MDSTITRDDIELITRHSMINDTARTSTYTQTRDHVLETVSRNQANGNTEANLRLLITALRGQNQALNTLVRAIKIPAA
ncbi:hypothetical protein [Propionicimonas sp.]|uniref:hypothetical protein n=1 Tax=Propionicimonas sp. TaxID=1955623 RepID=UPI0017D96600|nr:hypothetical protein [Propionicimonas sp.]MBA3019639.1 hypothetical protein [Propionicimonas sp.]MBU4208016.1 hypothetical protein [Actinomycetota bacterium]MCG2805758.1 hypothetical protein [Propionicimonas sp.]